MAKAKSKTIVKEEKVVRFLKPLDGYREDDCATFEASIADKVIAAEYAEEITLEDTRIEEEV